MVFSRFLETFCRCGKETIVAETEETDETDETDVAELMLSMAAAARLVRRDSGKHRLVGGKLVLPERSPSFAASTTPSSSPASAEPVPSRLSQCAEPVPSRLSQCAEPVYS
jgi:hypothetical protein